MRVYAEQGQRDLALRQYRSCRDLLRRELAVEPSPETQHLQRQITAAADGPAALATLPPAMPTLRLGLPLPDQPSIAVLPFGNPSGDPAQQYLSDGLAEDIIAALSLFVIDRRSSFAHRGEAATAERIGRDLGVQYLVEGTIRRETGRIRIEARLIQASTSHQLWAGSFDSDIDLPALLDAQQELVRRIAGTLGVTIESDRRSQARRKPAGDMRAYDFWLRGMDCLHREAAADPGQAREWFGRALALDPHYARAYAGLSLSYFNEWTCRSWAMWFDNQAEALKHAREAIAHDDSDHLCHCVLAKVHQYRREFALARRHFERANTLNPNDAETHALMAIAWSFFGEADRAIEAGKTAIRLNPLQPDWYFISLGYGYFAAREYEAAAANFALAPEAAADSQAYLAASCAYAGRLDDARRHAKEFADYFRTNIAGHLEQTATECADWLLYLSPYQRQSDADHLLEGLRRAGLPASHLTITGHPPARADVR
jgi:TolB-like protein